MTWEREISTDSLRLWRLSKKGKLWGATFFPIERDARESLLRIMCVGETPKEALETVDLPKGISQNCMISRLLCPTMFWDYRGVGIDFQESSEEWITL